MSELTFTPGDSMFVAHQSVVKTTGSGEPAVPTATLDMYNVETSQQLQGIRDRIRHDQTFGLPSFGRDIDPNALKDIATDMVLQDLADLIFFQSFPVGQPATALTAGRSLSTGAGGGGLMSRAARFTQANPMAALTVAAAAGMVVGMLIGGVGRR